MSDELVWNLSAYGQYNILKSLHDKLGRASVNLECSSRPRTIINIDSYEATVICWALQDYSKKIEEQLKQEHFADDGKKIE